MSIAEITTLLAAIGALVGSLYTIYRAQKTQPMEHANMGADVAEKYEAMAARQAAQLDQLRARIDALQAEQAHNQAEIERLRAGVNLLVSQLKANGIKPMWEPEAQS